jgi:thiol-disulfide isomerase/thioredoxin
MRTHPLLLAVAVAAAVLAVAAGITGAPFAPRAQETAVRPTAIPPPTDRPTGDELASIDKAREWINSPPLKAAGLRGKVVLIDFWTYSCINWLRQAPYVRAWAEKYRDRGLVVIGVHAPEFGFEHDLDNVRRAVRAQDVAYPVVIDNDYAVWRAFENHYWPALYFVDAEGRVRHHQFGEGDYEQSEAAIRQLLAEAGDKATDGGAPVSPDARGAMAPADWKSLESSERYLGYDRTEGFASPGGIVPDARHGYAAPAALPLNQWALAGNWTVGKQAVVLHEANGRIVYRFHARDVHLVMGAAARGRAVRFRVLVDGRPPGAAHGVDVDEQGNGTVTEPRLYQLIRQPAPIGDRQFEIEFLDPGVEAYVFTFG